MFMKCNSSQGISAPQFAMDVSSSVVVQSGRKFHNLCIGMAEMLSRNVNLLSSCRGYRYFSCSLSHFEMCRPTEVAACFRIYKAQLKNNMISNIKQDKPRNE